MTAKSSTMEKQPDRFRQSLAATARVMSDKPLLDVRFAGKDAKVEKQIISLPVANIPDTKVVRRLRGQCDAFSFRLRYHDPLIHQQFAPEGQLKRAIFYRIEQIRCEFIGSRYLPGTQHNLRILMREHFQPRTDAIKAGEAHVHMADLLELFVFESLTEQKLPEYSAAMLRPWRAHLTSDALRLLAELKLQRYNQRAFAAIVVRFIGVFGILDDDAPWELDNRLVGDIPEEQQPLNGDEHLSDVESKADEEQGPTLSNICKTEQDRDNSRAEPDSTSAARQVSGNYLSLVQSAPNLAAGVQAKHSSYRIFSTKYDKAVNAGELVNHAEMRALRKRLDNQLPQVQGMISRLANRLQRRLYAKQLREWQFDMEEGLLDSGRLSRVILDPLHALSFKQEQEGEFRDTVVTLLIDNSGSMAGRKITTAAICSDILASTLERCGIKSEILGFTTNTWKGGRPMQDWLSQGQDHQPGRMNEILHIIYKSADAPWRRSRENLGLMLRSSLLKENIDGEALLWAHSRLIARPEERQILIVISDGIPVDDATLSANNHIYLDRHLREVIHFIENRSPVEIAAIGIGHDVTDYYQQSVTIADVDELGRTIIEQLSQLFVS